MAGKTKLNPDVHQQIVQFIGLGCYDWVAAARVGITPRTFRNWMTWGEKGNKRYRQFYFDVMKARAEARAKAEIVVRQSQPLAWLRYGPGRERPNEPGWTEAHLIEGEVAHRVEIVLKWPEELHGRAPVSYIEGRAKPVYSPAALPAPDPENDLELSSEEHSAEGGEEMGED